MWMTSVLVFEHTIQYDGRVAEKSKTTNRMAHGLPSMAFYIIFNKKLRDFHLNIHTVVDAFYGHFSCVRGRSESGGRNYRAL